MNVRLSVALVALALLGSGTARAEMVDFSYALSVSSQVVSGSNGVYANAVVYSPSGVASATLGSTTAIGGGPAIFWSFVAPSNQSGYVDATADLKLSLTDVGSGRSGQFDIVAHFRGWVGPNLSPQPTLSFSPASSQAMQLGGYLYHVTPSPVAQLADAPSVPSVAFEITVTPASVANAPEPSSLALAAIAAVGLASGRRRRRAALAVA